MLIRYYQFDKEVIRELLGKKLTGRLRKDLDDVSEKTNIPLKSCRRQVCSYFHDFQHTANTVEPFQLSVNSLLTDNSLRWTPLSRTDTPLIDERGAKIGTSLKLVDTSLR